MKIHRRGSENKLLVLSKHELICYAVLLACIAGLAHSAENEKCSNTPQCICKWSGGKRMADCSNAGKKLIPFSLQWNAQIRTSSDFRTDHFC